MKVLIISSEPLYPSHTIGSCFELDQAESLIKRDVDARILSISSNIQLIHVIKAIAKKIFGLASKNKISSRLTFRDLFVLTKSRYSKKYLLKIYSIRGIVCYEVLGCFAQNVNKKYENWIETGRFVFREGLLKFSPELIHAHSRFLYASLLAEKIKLHSGIPFIITEHSNRFQNGNINELENSLVQKTYQNSSYNIAVSESLKIELKKYLSKQIEVNVLPNCLDSDFERLTLTSKKTEEYTFINIASLDKNKNQSLLLKAFARAFKGNEKVKLKIVGQGGLSSKLESESEKLNIQNQVKFLGEISRKNVVEELLTSNAFVLSSIYETFGVVLVEAMACGLPIISTKCGGPESIVNDSNGILVDSDIDKLADAMLIMLSNKDIYNPAKIREDCLAEYGSSVISKELISIYNSVREKGNVK